jgi:hypothetical protein
MMQKTRYTPFQKKKLARQTRIFFLPEAITLFFPTEISRHGKPIALQTFGVALDSHLISGYNATTKENPV